MCENDGTKALLEAQDRVLGKIRRDMSWYKSRSERNRVVHYILSTVVIICGVLAPMTVISASSGIGSANPNTALFGLAAEDKANISAVLTVIAGLAEAFRRRFRFERKWHSFYMASLNLRLLKDAYKVEKGKYTPCSPERRFLLEKLVSQHQAILRNETRTFFQAEFKIINPQGNSNAPPD